MRRIRQGGGRADSIRVSLPRPARSVVGGLLAGAAGTAVLGLVGLGLGAPASGRPAAPGPWDVPAATAPLGEPAPAPVGEGGYAFLATAADGEPVGFDRCRPVPVVLGGDAEPDGGRQLVHDGLAALAQATGLRFVMEGRTTERLDGERASYQPERYGHRWAPVLVEWSAPRPGNGLEPGVLGRAGPATWAPPGGPPRYVTGTAVFHGPAIDRLLRTGREEYARAVVLHELGHLVGLAHVADPYQVMHGVNAAPLADYRAGDLRGLERLGRLPCPDTR